MAVVYWRGLTPKYNPNPDWIIRQVYKFEAGSGILVKTLIGSEQMREFTFWLGRDSDAEDFGSCSR